MAEVGIEMAEVGNEMAEVGTEMAEVGTEMAEVGNEMAEVGTEMAEVGNEMAEVGTEMAEAGPAGIERVTWQTKPAGIDVVILRWRATGSVGVMQRRELARIEMGMRQVIEGLRHGLREGLGRED
eukprot:gene6509-7802_t